MSHKTISWTSLGLGLGLMANNAQATMVHDIAQHSQQPAQFQLIASTEGEGGEASGDTATQNAQYLALLGEVEGHMTVGTALYRLGAVDQAKTHMKHPKDEIYTNLLPIMKERNLKGFEAELEAVASAVNAGKPSVEVDALFAKLQTAINANRPTKIEAALAVKAVVSLLRTAGEDFELGAKDGKIINLHEYQDAWGFVQAAKTLLASLNNAEKTEHASELAKISALLDGLEKNWPNIAAQAEGIGKAQNILIAAANIELILYTMN